MEKKIKIYAPVTKEAIGGGWTFFRNFKKGMKNLPVDFVDNWRDCDIFFITGITIVDLNEVNEARNAGKRIVLRVDNVPRKSRNRRSSPHERLKEVADLADVVIYQSEWASDYCDVLCGAGNVIYNGADTDIFYPPKNEDPQRSNKYLFIYHGKNEQKGFWTAHLMFQQIFRKNPNAKFYFINDFGSDTRALIDSNFDFWNGEKFEYLPKIEDPEEVAELMRECGTLIYPAIADASPNAVVEALNCGMKIIGYPDKTMAGTAEIIEQKDLTLERMCEDYYGVFLLLIG